MAAASGPDGAAGQSDSLDLVTEEIRELAATVCASAGDPPEPFGVYSFSATSDEARLARHVERSVFAETFGNSPELLDAEYGPYESATFFFCVLDQRRHVPAGMMRVVLPSPAGSKSLGDIERVWGQRVDAVLARSGLSLEADRVWDVATLAVGPEYRRAATNGFVSMALYQSLCRSAVRYGVGWIVTIFDLIVLEMIQQISSGCFESFVGVEPLRYLDSPASLPVYCDVETQLPRLRTVHPATYELLIEGRGLEEAVRPLAWDRMDGALAAASTH